MTGIGPSDPWPISNDLEEPRTKNQEPRIKNRKRCRMFGQCVHVLVIVLLQYLYEAVPRGSGGAVNVVTSSHSCVLIVMIVMIVIIVCEGLDIILWTRIRQ